MRYFICKGCDQSFPVSRDKVRRPWRCKPCVGVREAERIQARNAQDCIKRRENREPLCADCKTMLVRDDSGVRRDMAVYCKPCRNMRRRRQDSRRNGSNLIDVAKRDGTEALPTTRAT